MTRQTFNETACHWRLVRQCKRAIAFQTLLLSIALLPGCGAFVAQQPTCGDDPPAIEEVGLSPIQRAIHFLNTTQIREDIPNFGRMDYAGNWPQCYTLSGEAPYVRDISPFMVAFVHHALSTIDADTAGAIGLTADEYAQTRDMRERAVEFMLRFAGRPNGPEANTFGFWPEDMDIWLPGNIAWSAYLSAATTGPEFEGTRTPANFTTFPEEHAIYPDADVTSTTYVVLLDRARLDSGPTPPDSIAYVFAPWRDLGQVPQRNDQPWVPQPSGAFLTWLANGSDPAAPSPNDVDLPVNANVLYALGRYGDLDAAGVPDAVQWINDAVMVHRVHQAAAAELSLYYPDNLSFHYFVVRARYQGGVSALAPAADALVDDLLATAIVDGDGFVYWDRGAPTLNTAFAASALMLAGAGEPLWPGAIDYLTAQQDALTGAWKAEEFFFGALDARVVARWSSAAFTTAMALEALVRHALAQ